MALLSSRCWQTASTVRIRDWDGQAHIQWGRAKVGGAAVGLRVLGDC